MSEFEICREKLTRHDGSEQDATECGLCGFRSESEMCPACGGSRAAAESLESLRTGGD